jgi:hypothetical protein
MAGSSEDSPSQLIDAKIEELDDWRGETLARVRELIKQADPEVVEEWKGRLAGRPLRPLQLQPRGQRQACDRIREDDEIDAKELKPLIRAAVALNES